MGNPMLEWGRSSVRQEMVAHVEEIRSLDATVRRDSAIERQNIQLLATDKESDHYPSPHAIFFHESGSAREVFWVFERLRKGDSIPCNVESLLSLHRQIFSPYENAGVLSVQDNGVRVCDGGGSEHYVYHAAPAEEKGCELDWAFAAYNEAKAADPYLAPAYAVCLAELLVKIHPFEDGNGRTSRVMLVSELRAAGLEHAADIPFEGCHAKYRRLACCMLGKADGGRYSRAIDFWPYTRLILDLVRLGYMKLPKKL